MSMLFLAATAAQAGILRVVFFPVRHFVKTTRAVGKTMTYPVRHPKKTVW